MCLQARLKNWKGAGCTYIIMFVMSTATVKTIHKKTLHNVVAPSITKLNCSYSCNIIMRNSIIAGIVSIYIVLQPCH